MKLLEQALRQLGIDLSITETQLLTIASRFQEHMEQGLKGSDSSLKMFPSYLQSPLGNEVGTFLALDFGGSNVRAAVIELKGDGKFLELHKLVRPLADPASGLDYRSASATSEELFDFLAKITEEVLTFSMANQLINYNSEPVPLGFAFSFPYHQRKIGEGFLLHWDKEVKTSGVVGKDVGQLLSCALTRRGLNNLVEASTIINDTVTTFLTAAYQDPSVDIGAIIGTGHNTCYLEQKAPGLETPMIINTESGNFSAAPQTAYDQALDLQSDNPGQQQFEKMLSGKYLGELFRQIVLGLSPSELDFSLVFPARWNDPYSISSKDLAFLLTEETASHSGARDEHHVLPRIAQMLTKRSARLVAASFIGVVRHLDPYLDSAHTIAIDGSLFERMPGYAQELTAALSEGFGCKASQVTVKLSAGGSLTGAAIAAALAELQST